ncbi:MAG: sulfite exporter TauE/SafE family protein [Verrucomicrobiota bacterium]|nr:sulfite exporter TauE/SafE family protein [Verrucomicrobiota bacterium]
MRKRIYLTGLFVIFILVGLGAAHPLGNFTVNHYSRIEVEKTQVKLREVLDMAEIPTFQESQKIDTNKDGTLSPEELNLYADQITPEYVANLQLSVDGQPIALRAVNKEIGLHEGSGGLPILRATWDLLGDLPNFDAAAIHQLKFENKNNSERIGWNEIVAERVSGITDELKTYPGGESINAPLAERKAAFSFTSAALAADVKPLQNRDGHISPPIEKDSFAELISVPEITPSIILFGLLLAFGLGAMHALSPGHGKTVVGAYLVGSRGTVKHAVFLGATVTITHTLGVFALGLLTLFASEYILPEKLMPILNFVSGLLVLFIGLALFKDRLFIFLGWKKDTDLLGHEKLSAEIADITPDDDLPAEYVHDNPSAATTHTHLPPQRVTWRSLLALGISGGLLPCPSALVLMLAAISKNRIGYGLVLTIVFSFGLAATLTAVGLAFLYIGNFFGSSSFGKSRIVKALPVFSAFVITCLGAIICYSAI